MFADVNASLLDHLFDACRRAFSHLLDVLPGFMQQRGHSADMRRRHACAGHLAVTRVWLRRHDLLAGRDHIRLVRLRRRATAAESHHHAGRSFGGSADRDDIFGGAGTRNCSRSGTVVSGGSNDRNPFADSIIRHLAQRTRAIGTPMSIAETHIDNIDLFLNRPAHRLKNRVSGRACLRIDEDFGVIQQGFRRDSGIAIPGRLARSGDDSGHMRSVFRAMRRPPSAEIFARLDAPAEIGMAMVNPTVNHCDFHAFPFNRSAAHAIRQFNPINAHHERHAFIQHGFDFGVCVINMQDAGRGRHFFDVIYRQFGVDCVDFGIEFELFAAVLLNCLFQFLQRLPICRFDECFDIFLPGMQQAEQRRFAIDGSGLNFCQ